MMRRVGVLGGMGPEATILFMQRCLAAVKTVDDAGHIPLIVDQNPQVPSRIAALIEGDGADPSPVLRAMAQGLQTAGAEALVMVCNTAHHYAPAIVGAVNIPFFNIIELASARAAKEAPGGRVAILGSPALAQVGVYDAPLARHGLTQVHLAHPERVLDVIRRIKSDGPTAQSVSQLNAEIDALEAAGADAVCVACTEFSLVAADLRANVALFDALDELVAETVRFATNDTTHNITSERTGGGTNPNNRDRIAI